MSDLFSTYRTFCRVVERCNLTQAGIDLDLAQATVSRHLQELEQRYGVPLLTRTTRRVRPTAAGEQVYAYACSVLRSEGDLAQRLIEAGRGVQGRICLAGPGGFGHVVLAPFVIAHGQRHPGLRIALQLSERRVDLIEEGVDVAIRIGTLADSSLIARPLGQVPERLVASAAWVARHGMPDTPAALAGLPRMGLSSLRTQALHLQSSDDAAVSAVVDTPAVFEVDSALALRDAVLAGWGWGALHHYMVADALAQGQLVSLLPGWHLPCWGVHAVFATRARPQRVDHLVDAFAQHLRQTGLTLEQGPVAAQEQGGARQ